MSRRSSLLWSAAMMIALAPHLQFLLAEEGSGQSFLWMSAGSCTGHGLNGLVEPAVHLVPVYYVSAPLVAAAFLAWWLCRRAGRARLGRVLSRCAALLLILLHLPELLFLMLDAALGPECLESWGPPELVGMNVRSHLNDLVPPLLVLLAVPTPRPPFVRRRGRLFRTVTIAIAVAAVVLLVGMERIPGKVSAEHELDCAGFGGGTERWLTEAEKLFLCDVRGYGTFYSHEGNDGRWSRVADRDVVRHGHLACASATGKGGTVDEAYRSLSGPLGQMCPAVEQAQIDAGRRQKETEDAYVAEREKACAAHPRHRPKAKPVRQARGTMWAQAWTIDAWEQGKEGYFTDRVEDLVGSEPGVLTVWAADETGHACVTGESYTKAPPLETKGWEQVVEVPTRASAAK